MKFKLFEQTRRGFLAKLGKAALGAMAPKSIVSAATNLTSPKASAAAELANVDQINLDKIIPGLIKYITNNPDDVNHPSKGQYFVSIQRALPALIKLRNTGVYDSSNVDLKELEGDTFYKYVFQPGANRALSTDGIDKPVQFFRGNQPIKVTYMDEDGRLHKNSDTLYQPEDFEDNPERDKQRRIEQEKQWRAEYSKRVITISLPRSVATQLKTVLSHSLNGK